MQVKTAAAACAVQRFAHKVKARTALELEVLIHLPQGQPAAGGLGLKEAKDFVEAVAAGPKTVKEGLSKEDADKMAAQFKEVGGECEIK